MPNNQTVLYNTNAGVATIQLNRPERRNALTPEMLVELANALKTAGDDSTVRAVVVTGAGKGFCAGQDLGAFDVISSPQQVRDAVLRYYKPVITHLCTLQKPIVAAVNGVAAGAGASIALACDLRIMADDASLLQAFINIGLVPDAGSCWFLTRLVGYSRAFEIAIEGERIPAQRCLELGLADRVAPATSLLEAAQSWAQQLAQRPTYAVGLTKKIMLEAVNGSLDAIIDLEAEMQGMAIASEDHPEGISAFREKRMPHFKGK